MSERTAFLIETVKNYPMLYDTSHEEFRNLKLKTSIWNDIALIVGDNNGDATKARWRNLRDCYSKHLRSKSSGTTSKHTARYKTWPWVQQMSFLESFTGMESQNLSHNGNDSEKNMDGSLSSMSDQSPQKLKSLKRHRDNTDWQVDKVLSFLNNTSSSDYDAVDLIFLGYARTIKKFSPHRQALVKYKIAKIIMEAELEHIQEISQSALDFINAEDRCESPADYIEPPEVKLETLEDNAADYNSSQI